ncbi:MAG TPA: signal peptidase II [Candidatus Nanoarchaeia archaeon]|nr:signal peptidase II [Candidatus Nanoarchaeia archaeon]
MGKKNIFILSTALTIVFLDQLTKFLIRANFKLGESISIIRNIFHITYVTNTGAAFSIFQGFNLFFIIFLVIFIGVVIYYLKNIKENEKMMQIAIGLLLGGTIGNLIDRISIGAVIDFIDFRIWPVFNVADSAVSVSVVLLIILLWKK